jgi:hypothetical protein
MSMLATFPRVDEPEQEGRCIAVNVEVCESAPGFDVLSGKIAQERRFAAAGSPEYRDMRRPARVA